MTLEILVGCISAGKSTYSAKRANEGAIIINDDSIVNALHGNHYLKYNKNLKNLYKSIGDLTLSWAGANNFDAVIDRTNLNPSTRRRYIELGRAFGYENIVAAVLPMLTPEEAARRRFESDSRGASFETWLKVANEHFKQYQEVTLDEGFDKIVKL